MPRTTEGYCNHCKSVQMITSASKRCKNCGTWVYHPSYLADPGFRPVRGRLSGRENIGLNELGKSWCNRCQSTRPLSLFQRVRSKRGRFDNICSECYEPRSYQTTAESRLKQCPKCNRLSEFAYNRSRKDGLATYCKQCTGSYKRELVGSSPFLRMKKNIKRRFRLAFERGGTRKSEFTESMLGCTFDEAFSLLTLGGRLHYDPDVFHIDHICPLSVARDEIELVKLNHYTNLRLLPKQENLIKGDKISAEAV